MRSEHDGTGAGPDWWQAFFTEGFGALQLSGLAEDTSTADADRVQRLLGLQPGDAVLDAPCGTGRIGLELAARGIAVTGVDFNAGVVERAETRARERELSLDLRVDDLRTLDFESRFDAVVCFGGSFGYFDESENLAFARGTARALKHGGRFLIDTHVLESLLPKYMPRGWSTHEAGGDETRILQERRFELESGRVNSTWILQRGGDERRFDASVRIYSYRELCALLREAGFRTFAGFAPSGDSFEAGSDRLFLVATKS